MGTPWALGIPSQSPVPVGLRPAEWPRSGTRAGSTARLERVKGAADTEAITAETMKAEAVNFMVEKLERRKSIRFLRGRSVGAATVKLFSE
jgi:hypothetical protein